MAKPRCRGVDLLGQHQAFMGANNGRTSQAHKIA
jgi:hypothetical protein